LRSLERALVQEGSLGKSFHLTAGRPLASIDVDKPLASQFLWIVQSGRLQFIQHGVGYSAYGPGSWIGLDESEGTDNSIPLDLFVSVSDATAVMPIAVDSFDDEQLSVLRKYSHPG
jgi:hypothetical protein